MYLILGYTRKRTIFVFNKHKETMKTTAQKIDEMATKAFLIFKASKLKLTKIQMTAYCKIVKGERTMVLEHRSIKVLIKRGLVVENENRHNKGNNAWYIAY